VGRLRHGTGLWAVTFAFLVVMGFITVPNPLWGLYQERDGFSTFTITLIFSAYAVGVMISLFFVGHLSDVHGRRRVLVPALLVNVLAGAVLLLWTDLAGLLVARVVSGLGMGATVATATAWMAELHAVDRPSASPRRAQVAAISANLGGLGVGALVSGLFAQWVGHPLVVPYLVFMAGMLVAVVVVAATPETNPARRPRPPYRVQRVSVPAEHRGRYFAVSTGTIMGFAGMSLFGALAPRFLAGMLHHGSHALAGATQFLVFVGAVGAQLATARQSVPTILRAGTIALLAGLAATVAAVWLPDPSLPLFMLGGVVVGTGGGLVFKGAIATVAAQADDEHRAEALAGLFLAAYIGLAVPIVGLGALTEYVSARDGVLVFGVLLATGILACAPTLIGRRASGAAA
jgi:MFS family permease